MEQFTHYLSQFQLFGSYAEPVAALIASFGVLLLAWIANTITVRFIVRGIRKMLAARHHSDGAPFKGRHIFDRLSQFVPAYIIYAAAPLVLGAYPVLMGAVLVLAKIYMLIVAVLFVDGLINAVTEFYQGKEIGKRVPIVSFGQVAKIVLYFLGFMGVLSIALGQSPFTLFAGLGALTAVIMLVFRDPILGLVAGIQLSANKMVTVGDWIEMPGHDVDGDVMEIALTTVKIRNFDKTITTVPTQALINDSFKNWRGMKETGGRRIKRSVMIDINTIKHCDEEMLKRFAKVQYIADYIARTQDEIKRYNDAAKVDLTALANGRRMTNVGTFRAYIEAYLRHHPRISKSLTLLVRQLQPGDKGLPIEIYVFTLDTDWIAYEKIQADIFDHILAIAPAFDLGVYQAPSGRDLLALKGGQA